MTDVEERLRRSGETLRRRVADRPALEPREPRGPRVWSDPLFAVVAVVFAAAIGTGVFAVTHAGGGGTAAIRTAPKNFDSYGQTSSRCTVRTENSPSPSHPAFDEITNGVPLAGPHGTGLCLGLLNDGAPPRYVGFSVANRIIAGGLVDYSCPTPQPWATTFAYGDGTIYGSVNPRTAYVVVSIDTGADYTAATFEIPGDAGQNWYALSYGSQSNPTAIHEFDGAGTRVPPGDSAPCGGHSPEESLPPLIHPSATSPSTPLSSASQP